MSTASRKSEDTAVSDRYAATTAEPPTLSQPFDREKRSLLFAIVFSALSISCWVLICVSNYMPVYGSCHSYTANCFDDYAVFYDGRSPFRDLHHNEKFLRAVRIVSTFLAVAILPLTVFICGRAAVISHSNRHPTLRQALNRAGAGKFDLSRLSPRHFRRRADSPIIFLGALLAVVGSLLYPLQEIFVTWQRIQVPSGTFQSSADGTVFDFARADVDFQNHLINFPTGVQNQATVNYVWANSSKFDDATYGNPWAYNAYLYGDRAPYWRFYTHYPGYGVWISVQPNGTNTGLLSNYSMALNTTVTCVNEALPLQPRGCSGSQGFSTRYRGNFSNMALQEGLPPRPDDYVDVQVCVPGDPTAFPWRLDIGFEPQELVEELYIDYLIGRDYSGLPPDNDGWHTTRVTTNTTMHCTAKTSLSYFELPNYANGGVPGPLSVGLGAMPPSDPQIYDWSESFWPIWLQQYDLSDEGDDTTLTASILDGWDTSTGRSADETFPNGTLQTLQAYHGPLLSTALVMFLNATVVQRPTYTRDLQRVVPLYDYLYEQCYLDSDQLPFLYAEPYLIFLQLLSNPNTSQCLFELTSTIAHTSSLLALGPLYDGSQEGKMQSMPIFTDQGYPTQKLHVPLWFIIFESILIAFYVVNILGLAGLSLYDVKWTATLDGLAFFMLGAMYADRLPPFQNKAELEKSSVLDELHGYVHLRTAGAQESATQRQVDWSNQAEDE